MNFSIRKLLCLLLAFCLVLGCFAGCDNDSGKDRKGNDKDEKDPADEAREELDAYELNGLTYYLSEDFADDVDSGTDYAYYSNGDGIDIQVTAGSMDDLTDDEIRTSKDFAQFFMDFLGDMYDEAEMDSKHGIYYMVGIYEGVANIMGYYVKDGYGWVIYITNEAGEATDDLIDMVTLGQIDKNFDPSDYISEEDPSEDYYEEEYYEEEFVEEEFVESDSDYFTVHAYVPESWGLPACWAWSNTTGENVFSAWPGEYMDYWGDYYYTIQIPAWAEYIIVNGNDGAIQTMDEPVEPGYDIWVVVSAIDDAYYVYFYEPSADELAEAGY